MASSLGLLVLHTLEMCTMDMEDHTLLKEAIRVSMLMWGALPQAFL